jgi:hypothetical protein
VDDPTVSFLSYWQPLKDEDAHTALVFGFLRHAPAQAALDPWLSRTLDRDVSAEPLERSCLWPIVPAVTPGFQYTEPELVLTAHDGAGELIVVVEVKPGYDMFSLEQIRREVIDVAHDRDALRVACVMIGADLARPPSTTGWLQKVLEAAQIHLHRLPDVELVYSSFAQLGQVIAECGGKLPEWSRYAADVNAQLLRKGLLGYKGAPMIDDLEGLTVPNAVEVYNRAVRAARQFLLQLHAQSGFEELGLKPPPGWNFRMQRDDPSQVLTEDEFSFTTTVFFSEYESKRDAFPKGARAFVAFDLLGRDGDETAILAGYASCLNMDDLAVGRFASAIRDTELVDNDRPWSENASFHSAVWRFDRRPWHSGQADEDIAWALDRLRAAADRARI